MTPSKFSEFRKNFNSRTSCEVRREGNFGNFDTLPFQLTHLLRGATAEYKFDGVEIIFQLTHLLRGAT